VITQRDPRLCEQVGIHLALALHEAEHGAHLGDEREGDGTALLQARAVRTEQGDHVGFPHLERELHRHVRDARAVLEEQLGQIWTAEADGVIQGAVAALPHRRARLEQHLNQAMKPALDRDPKRIGVRALACALGWCDGTALLPGLVDQPSASSGEPWGNLRSNRESLAPGRSWRAPFTASVEGYARIGVGQPIFHSAERRAPKVTDFLGQPRRIVWLAKHREGAPSRTITPGRSPLRSSDERKEWAASSKRRRPR
jgi:hypothetical protein